MLGLGVRPGVRGAVGTIFEDRHIPLHIWLQAMFLIASSKKGISSNQFHRTLGLTLKSAWLMSHRIREAMSDTAKPLMGGDGGIVEVDETYCGLKDGDERTKRARSQNDGVTIDEFSAIIRAYVAKETRMGSRSRSSRSSYKSR